LVPFSVMKIATRKQGVVASSTRSGENGIEMNSSGGLPGAEPLLGTSSRAGAPLTLMTFGTRRKIVGVVSRVILSSCERPVSELSIWKVLPAAGAAGNVLGANVKVCVAAL